MKDPFGHGSNARGAAMRGVKITAIEKHRKNHPSAAAITKLRKQKHSAADLRQGIGHKSKPVGVHAAMGGAYAFGDTSGNGY
jgi:hypothetical protein